jgi:hypothetical protein
VSNIPRGVSPQELASVFGTPRVDLCTDELGKPTGVAFIAFASGDLAACAVRDLHGHAITGHSCTARLSVEHVKVDVRMPGALLDARPAKRARTQNHGNTPTMSSSSTGDSSSSSSFPCGDDEADIENVHVDSRAAAPPASSSTLASTVCSSVVLSPQMPTTPDGSLLASLAQSVRSECELKCGSVQRVLPLGNGTIRIDFATPEGAALCVRLMHGRTYASCPLSCSLLMQQPAAVRW